MTDIQCKHGLALDDCQDCLPRRAEILDILELQTVRREAAKACKSTALSRKITRTKRGIVAIDQDGQETVLVPRLQPEKPIPRLKLSEVILEAARSLPQPFVKEDLVLAAWNARPEVFGLGRHFLEHPDANKVLSYLYGKRGLLSRGKIQRTGEGFEVQ